MILASFLPALLAASTVANAASGEVSGVVLDAVSGQGVPGVLVGVAPTHQPAGRRIVPYLYSPHVTGDPVRSDAQGRFLLRDLAPGTYVLQAGHPAYGSPRFLADDAVRLDTPFQVEAGRPVKDVQIRLVPASELRGMVTGAHGEAVAGAKVYLISKTRELGTDSDETDEQGRFAFSHLFSDDYVVQVLAPSGAETPRGYAFPLTSYRSGQVLNVGEGAKIAGVHVVLQPVAARRLAGRIRSAGKLRAARVEIRPLLDDPAEVVRHRSAVPDASGAFEFEDVPPGRYVIRARGTEIAWTMAGDREAAVSGETLVDWRPGAAGPVEVEVRPPVRVRGIVRVDGAGSQADVSVSFRGREMPWRVYGVSAKAGAGFELTVPPDGAYAVSMVLAKGNHYLKSVRVGDRWQSPSQVRLPQGAAEVEVELLVSSQGAQIEFERPAGVSVYDLNAAVFIYGKQGNFERSLHALIDRDGGVRVHGVPPGHHRVLVWVGEAPPCQVDGAGACAGLGDWITVTEAGRHRVEWRQ